MTDYTSLTSDELASIETAVGLIYLAERVIGNGNIQTADDILGLAEETLEYIPGQYVKKVRSMITGWMMWIYQRKTQKGD